MISALPLLLMTALPGVVPQAPGSHTELHSSGVQVFVEFPDLAATKAAYPKAPLLQLLHDPDLAQAIEELSQRPFDPDALLAEALEGAGDPHVRGVLLGMLGDLSAVSLSVGGFETPGKPRDDSQEGLGDSPLDLAHGLHARLVFEFATEALAAAAGPMLAGLDGAGGLTVRAEDGGGVVEFAELPGASLQYRVDGARFGLLLRMEGSPVPPYGADVSVADNLAGDSRYTSLAGAAKKPKGAAVVHVYSATGPELINGFIGRVGGEPFDDLQFALLRPFVPPLQPYAATTTLDGSTFRSVERTAAPPSRHVDTAFLQALPADAIGAWAFTIDAQTLLEGVLAQAADGESTPEELMAQAEQQTGVHPQRDLVAHLGSTVFVYLEPIQAIGPPKLRAYVELKDAEAFGSSFAKIAAWLGESFPDEIGAKTKAYRGVDLTTFDVGALESWAMMRPAPTFGVVDGRLLVTLNAVHAKREIKRLAQAEGEEAAHSLLASPALSGEDLVSVGYLDWPQLVDGVYGLIKTAAGLFGGLAGPDMPDLSKLPPIDVVTRHFSPAQSITVQEGGLRITRSESPFGPEVLLFAAAGTLAGAIRVDQASNSDSIHATEAPSPVRATTDPNAGVSSTAEPVQADESALEQTTRDRLRVLRTGIAVYRMEHGSAPAALGDLSGATESFPNGFLGGRTDVLVDGWGRAFGYSSDESGSTVWSFGPDGVDAGGAGDDIQLL